MNIPFDILEIVTLNHLDFFLPCVIWVKYFRFVFVILAKCIYHFINEQFHPRTGLSFTFDYACEPEIVEHFFSLKF